MQAAQVIALLLPDNPAAEFESDSPTQGAAALVRDAEGKITITAIAPDDEYFSQLMNTGCFKRGKPIVDPVSRDVMGYEMEMVSHPLLMRARSALGI